MCVMRIKWHSMHIVLALVGSEGERERERSIQWIVSKKDLNRRGRHFVSEPNGTYWRAFNCLQLSAVVC